MEISESLFSQQFEIELTHRNLQRELLEASRATDFIREEKERLDHELQLAEDREKQLDHEILRSLRELNRMNLSIEEYGEIKKLERVKCVRLTELKKELELSLAAKRASHAESVRQKTARLAELRQFYSEKEEARQVASLEQRCATLRAELQKATFSDYRAQIVQAGNEKVHLTEQLRLLEQLEAEVEQLTREKQENALAHQKVENEIKEEAVRLEERGDRAVTSVFSALTCLCVPESEHVVGLRGQWLDPWPPGSQSIATL
ncbi:hypothetical protein PAPYR_10928 [Paratrimastix pyriformis]|uniref:Uncharacterized protein n=1 Tax=Paratrimastix pyriformis TaxID=342808 RepID=A0ABQ8UAK7_9EUKA|nr:hypothetical protein PAPYR_10928 [Paratrimastix pyriformis]